MTSHAESTVPSHFGLYPVLAEVRAGGTTAVYQVQHPITQRLLALKTTSRLASPERCRIAEQQLERETEVRASLDHPTLLPLYDRLNVRGAPVLLGPWLSGGTLLQRWQQRPPLDEVLSFTTQLCDGLDALHAAGWVHGDLSPANIMFGGDGRARLIDFGSCIPTGSRRQLEPQPDASGFPARWGVTRLTSAPECWTGEPVDARTDLYALAVMLYYGLVGSWPFLADDKETLTRQHDQQSVPLPSQRSPLWGKALDDMLLRALAKAPAERFESGAALNAALRAALATSPGSAAAQPSMATPASIPEVSESLRTTWRAQEVVEHFSAGLPSEERRQFEAALALLRRRTAGQRSQAQWQLRELMVPIAALRTAEGLGLLEALAQRPRTSQELASHCSLDVDRVERLCRFLAADGRLRAQADGWSLEPPLLALYEQGVLAHPLRHPIAAIEAHWTQLSSWVQSGKPALAMDADLSGQTYASPVEGLGEQSEGQARAVAEKLTSAVVASEALASEALDSGALDSGALDSGALDSGALDSGALDSGALDSRALVPDRAAILDVGAGSGVWSLALASRWPQASITALDRPQVLEVTRARAQASGLADRLETLAGSWQDVTFPDRRYGVIVVAKFCHLESRESLARLFQRLAPLLSPDGRLVIIDSIPERLAEATPEVLRYDLSLALRTASGRIHDRAGFEQALATAGLQAAAFWNVTERGGRLDVLVARPRTNPKGSASRREPDGQGLSTRSALDHSATQPHPLPAMRTGGAGSLDLPALLAPVSVETLLTHVEKRTLLHIPARASDRFTALFGWEAFFGLLQRGAIPKHKLRIMQDRQALDREKEALLDARGRIDGVGLRALCRKGVSIILNRVGAASPGLWALAADVEQRLGDTVEITAIASLAECGAIRAHYDFQDLLLLQVEGAKHWTFLGEPVESPRLQRTAASKVPENVTASLTMRPGDVLFVPRGLHHICHAEERSLHVGLIITRRTGDHFLQWFARQCEQAPALATTLTRTLGAKSLAVQEAKLKRSLHTLLDQASLSAFLEEGDAEHAGVIDLNFHPPGDLSPETRIRRATLRQLPLPEEGSSPMYLTWRTTDVALSPAMRAVLALLNRDVVLTVETLLARLESQHSPHACREAIRTLADEGLVSVERL